MVETSLEIESKIYIWLNISGTDFARIKYLLEQFKRKKFSLSLFSRNRFVTDIDGTTVAERIA